MIKRHDEKYYHHGDSIFHHAFLSYVSDSGLLVPCMYPHGLSFMSPNLKMIASLDHAMWFQKRDFKWDDWILYSTDSPHTGSSRATCMRAIS